MKYHKAAKLPLTELRDKVFILKGLEKCSTNWWTEIQN